MGIPLRPEVERKLPLYGITVMVNPGHGVTKANGTYDAGAKGKLGNTVIREIDLNEKVARNVQRKFQKLGANVIYVEKTLIDTIQKRENEIRPDLFVAIHHDAKSPGKNSGETLYAWGPSKKVANDINKKFKTDNTIPNNGVKSEWAKGLCVLKADSTINAVLVEGGFMTNKAELKKLVTPEYQDKIAQFIVDGSRNVLGKIAKQNKKNSELKMEQEFKRKYMWIEQFKPKTNEQKYFFTKESKDI